MDDNQSCSSGGVGLTDIPTEFEDIDPPYDNGVDTAVAAEETFVREGERIERRTEFRFLDDGGVHITQRLKNQGVFDSLTLNEAVAARLCKGLGLSREQSEGGA